MRRILLLCVLSASASCFPSDDPPIISELTIQPSTIPVGPATTVRGKFLYDNPDSHDVWANIEIELPNQNTVPVRYYNQSQPHNGVGAVDWWIEMRAVEAGTYDVVVQLENEDVVSNQLRGTFTAEP